MLALLDREAPEGTSRCWTAAAPSGTSPLSSRDGNAENRTRVGVRPAQDLRSALLGQHDQGFFTAFQRENRGDCFGLTVGSVLVGERLLIVRSEINLSFNGVDHGIFREPGHK